MFKVNKKNYNSEEISAKVSVPKIKLRRIDTSFPVQVL